MLYSTQKYKTRNHHFNSIEPAPSEKSIITLRFRKKPEWVIREVIRLTAFMPNHGCRKIADVFNRLHKHKRAMTVSKSTVYNIIIRHKHDIYFLRKQIKQRRPKPLPKNIIWSIDLTTITDDKKQQHITFGVIDNGTRACLLLKNIANKSSITLLRNLLHIIEAYGKPKRIRMDNEAVFKSKLFLMGLWILSIKPQFTEVACPWMNGRVERFFGTLKQHVHKIILTEKTLEQHLAEFRYWYNHVRTHNNLKGKAPAEAWSKIQCNKHGEAVYVSLWHGILNGFYFPPD
ncbi:MAG: integrase core domain-containing protein [Pseudomonadota bacterium]